VSYPVRFAYIDYINVWWPATSIAAAIGVPGYAKAHTYNYIALAFWSEHGPLDIVNIWSKPTYFFGSDSVFGTTDEQIRTNLKKAYNGAGIRVLATAFGANEVPTNSDPVKVAEKLGKFVLDYNLDGCDIDYEDNHGMEIGVAEAWLIAFTRKLRQMLPTHTITHAPQAPYFKNEYYPKGGYYTIDREVGNLIDFYNVQFYNQGDTRYNTYE
jgi:chitinase